MGVEAGGEKEKKGKVDVPIGDSLSTNESSVVEVESLLPKK